MQHVTPSFLPFHLGVNYPWLRYGEDFGGSLAGPGAMSLPANREMVRADFSSILDAGASVVRWFLFGDGRGGFVCRDGIPRQPHKSLFADVEATLQLAERCQLKLCFSLIDYLWLQNHAGRRTPHAHEHALHSSAGREAFLLNVLTPLFREFRGHPALFAWEIANEPEWGLVEFTEDPAAQLLLADFRAYANDVANAVHEVGNVPVTLGSARLLWFGAWNELPLDFYQAHYYPCAERETAGGLAQQLADLCLLDKPLWLGEIPARDATDRNYSLPQTLDLCRDAGLHGAAIWRWREPESHGTDLAIGHVSADELKALTDRERRAAQRV